MAVWKNTYQLLNGLRFVPFQNSPKSEESSSVRCHRDSDTFSTEESGGDRCCLIWVSRVWKREDNSAICVPRL